MTNLLELYLQKGKFSFVKEHILSGVHVSESLLKFITDELNAEEVEKKPLTERQRLFRSASPEIQKELRKMFVIKDKNWEQICQKHDHELETASPEERKKLMQEINNLWIENHELELDIKYFEKNRDLPKKVKEDLPSDLDLDKVKKCLKALESSIQPSRVARQNTTEATVLKNKAKIEELKEYLKKYAVQD